MSVIERETVAPQEVTTRDVLHRAADLLEEFGWRQHSFGGKEAGEFCALGAIFEAHSELGSPPIFHQISGKFGWDTATELGHGLATWNDMTGRTKAEVVVRLREAAEAA